MLALMLVVGCDPYGGWPDEPVFPEIYTAQSDLEPYEEVRWETESWDPLTDLAQAAQYLLKAQNHRPGAPVESLEHFEIAKTEVPPLGDGVRLSFVGDVMWVGGNWSAFLEPSAGLLDGDLRIGNLETPTSPEHSTSLPDLGLYSFNAPVEMLDGLPLDVVQLNNNHSLDVGDAGLEATVAQAESRGLTAVGVDRHAVVDVDGVDIALLSYTWGLNRRDITSTHELFVVPFGHVDEPVDLSSAIADIEGAAGDSDAVVVLLHWGFEYEYYPDPQFMQMARRLVVAGADVVVGQGPHVVQPPEICHVNQPERVPGVGTCSVRTDDGVPRDAIILYSLGNFGTIMPTIQAQVGIVATVSLANGVSGAGWTPAISLEAEGPGVLPADQVDDPAVRDEVERLSAHVGAGWRRLAAQR